MSFPSEILQSRRPACGARSRLHQEVWRRREPHTFSYAWIASALQRRRPEPNRSQIAAVFHFGIEIFLPSKCPCSTFPELCVCARWLIFMHALAGRNSPQALRLTSLWPRLQP